MGFGPPEGVYIYIGVNLGLFVDRSSRNFGMTWGPVVLVTARTLAKSQLVDSSRRRNPGGVECTLGLADHLKLSFANKQRDFKQ